MTQKKKNKIIISRFLTKFKIFLKMKFNLMIAINQL